MFKNWRPIHTFSQPRVDEHVPGVLWIETSTRGRGYIVDTASRGNLQRYIAARTRFLGDCKTGPKIVDTSFRVEGGQLWFGRKRVDVGSYSHAVFNFAVGRLTSETYSTLLEIRDFLVSKNIDVVNDPRRISCAADKLAFFETMSAAGYRVPNWKEVSDLSDLQGWEPPYILRTNNDTGGENCIRIDSKGELEKAWSHLKHVTENAHRFWTSRIFAVEYIDSFDIKYGFYIKYRLSMIRDNLLICLATPSDSWKVNLYDRMDGAEGIYCDLDNLVDQIVADNISLFVEARRATGIDTATFDFLWRKEKIVFLEVMPKFGLGGRDTTKMLADLEDKQRTTKFNDYYYDQESRNRRVYEMLFY